MIGLCGAHRVGKSTLARAYAEATGMPLVSSNISQIVADAGIDMRDDLPLGRRLEIQGQILDAAELDYDRQPGVFISDRTPLDMAAYVMAECLKGSGTSEEQELALAYVDRCFKVTNRFFSVVMLVEPGIPYVADPGKPPPNLMFQEHIHVLIRGFLCDDRLERDYYVVPRGLTDIGGRLAGLSGIWGEHLAKFQKVRDRFMFH